jgi:tripartite-type tricarboxylate transporter receptor subunit TctC
VHPSTGFSTVGELIAYARANPGKLNYATGGAGSAQHVSAELFKSMAKVDITSIGYKAGAPAIIDLLANRVQVYFGANNSLVPHVRAGKLKALATAGARRSRALPDLPAVAETVPGYDVSTWNALVLPFGVPSDIVQRVHAGATGVLALPEIRDRLAGQGIEVDPSTPAELADLVRREYELHGKLVKEAGIKVE